MREIVPEGIVVGIDEVGRGALAGPLMVACVALPDDPQVIGLDDSKKLSPKRRAELAEQIDEVALGVGIARVEPDEIDACGMAASLRVAMKRALTACEHDLAKRGYVEDIAGVLIEWQSRSRARARDLRRQGRWESLPALPRQASLPKSLATT